MLDPASTWAKKFNDLPKVDGTAWAKNLAKAVNDLTTSKMELTNIKTTPAQFTFGMAAFQAALLVLQPVTAAAQGAFNFADAWEKGILTSFMVVVPGASVGPPSPPTLFSVVATTLLDPPSLILAKLGLAADLSSLAGQDNSDAFAKAFRKAFLTLTYTTTGTNSIAPTPTPLVDALDPTI